MSRTITESEPISVNMLVTKDLMPIPSCVDVAELIGDDYVLVTQEDGALREVVQGRHMVLHAQAADFVGWVGMTPFWFFSPDTKKFQRMQLVITDERAG